MWPRLLLHVDLLQACQSETGKYFMSMISDKCDWSAADQESKAITLWVSGVPPMPTNRSKQKWLYKIRTGVRIMPLAARIIIKY